MFNRLRRTRLNPLVRDLVRETRLDLDNFIYPLFVVEGQGIRNEIASMPGVFQLSIDEILKECYELKSLGIKSILLFGIPSLKDSVGSDALSDDGIITRTLRAIKAEFGSSLLVITDLCFCEYTDHGHCGILDKCSVNNDATLEISAKQALIHAKNGADMIAPSGMMDGIITCLRDALDENGFENLPVMAYSTHSAMFCAWSPMRSKYLAIISRSMAWEPLSAFLRIRPISSFLTTSNRSSMMSSISITRRASSRSLFT